MNTSTTRTRNYRPKLGKIAMVVALASAMGGLGMTPAYGDEHDNGWHGEKNHGYKAAPAKYKKRPPDHRPNYYAPAPVYYAPAPVYYPPAPVYYAPQPSPGINLFIPIRIR
jgi:hypothetical protein